jgi:hypothetical protein
MRDTWEGFKIVWRREPLMAIAVVAALTAGVLAIVQMLYSLVR